MLNLNHKNLDVWKLSKKIISEIYLITKEFPKEELFGITSQLRRASVSIASNIAEGSSRKSNTERIRFYEISRSSLVEVDTQLEIAMMLKYIDEINIKGLDEDLNHLFAKMSKLIQNTK